MVGMLKNDLISATSAESVLSCWCFMVEFYGLLHKPIKHLISFPAFVRLSFTHTCKAMYKPVYVRLLERSSQPALQFGNIQICL